MKKLFGIFILGVIFISMGAGFVSAGISDDIRGVIEGTYNIFEPFLEQIVGDTGGSEVFLAKVLFLIIIFAIVWKSLEKIPFFSDSEWVLWVVSIAVSIVSVRWFGDIEIVKAVLLPYSALGITLTAGIPFVLYFLIVGGLSKTMRKVSWIFFIVVFIGLWYTRSGSGTAEVGDFAYIYLVTAGLAFLVLTFDGTIQKWKLQMHIEKAGAATTQEAIERIMQKKNKLPELLREGIIDKTKFKKREKEYNKEMAILHK